MKRGTANHPKTIALAEQLNLERWGAVGILESLWHFCAEYCPRGDIGKFSNKVIATGLGWKGDADSLIAGLREVGFLDACDCHRLRIHDWPDHCDNGVRGRTQVASSGFCECYVTHTDSTTTTEPTLSHTSAIAEPVTQDGLSHTSPGLGLGNGNGKGPRARAHAQDHGISGQRALITQCSEVLGRKYGDRQNNLTAAERALKHYKPAEVTAVLTAIRDGSTDMARWCRDRLGGDRPLKLSYLLRPGEKGAADTILDELAQKPLIPAPRRPLFGADVDFRSKEQREAAGD